MGAVAQICGRWRSQLSELAAEKSAIGPRAAPRIGAVLLAAGAGRRMGGRPKCLLQLDGVSVLARQLQALSQAGMAEWVVVLGHHAERIEQDPALAQWRARTVRHAHPEAGHVGSLRTGLLALSPGLDAVLVALADQPLIQAEDVRDVVRAFADRPEGTHMLQPTVQGLPGNPVMFSWAVRQHILAGDAQMGARQWQRAHPEGVYRWNTPNGHYRTDVDTEEDRLALERLTGHRLSWPADLA